ncbi:methyl-accepting chemotaxis protein [Gracilibacillus sp. YIM 98692]|uniref:methyl-accepting chemotaxis protein n=1 Tax=Gracilibacillus sp. YIM 98692 TaxID=2663532 RepID=UPI0013D7A5AC|nr:methyl-accepting chemotaxis protein [Gracilibacillus sp. YIM 98692]
MKMNKLWRDRSIGGKYGLVFSVVMVFFILSVCITYWLLSNVNQYIKETRSENQIVTAVSELMSLYQEKYLYIPEYIIDEDDERLLGYLELSNEFVHTAKSLQANIVTDEEQVILNQIITNNHELDEYYFSNIVPNVQQINTETFTKLQSEANLLKEETMELGNTLTEEAIASNLAAINKAEQGIWGAILTLISSIAISFVISIALMFFISRSIRKSLQQVVKTSDAIANGNLNVEKLDDTSHNEIGHLSKSINRMQESLKDMIVQISTLASTVDTQVQKFANTSNEIKEGSEQVAVTIEELAHGATNQADESSNISEKTSHFSERTNTAKQNGEQLVQTSEEVLSVSVQGDKQMRQSLTQMMTITETVQDSVTKVNGLEKQATSISEFVNTIRSIADQTNLLALNASIEAARAGESGKGFAVVAEEVRKLAEEVSESSESITEIVDGVKEEIQIMVEGLNKGFSEVNKGKEQIETSGQYFFDIKEKVSHMSERIHDISSTISYFQQSSDEINSSVEHIASISEESAAGSEQIASSAIQQKEAIQQVSDGTNELQQLVEKMNRLIKRFEI